MNRSEMIEKAARASHQWGLDFGGEHAEWDALRELTRREYREEAAAVLDVLLPQVTTVEELEALPTSSILAFPLYARTPWLFRVERYPIACLVDVIVGGFRDLDWLVERYGPATVVWQP